jgi:hypothetical protein
MMLNLFDHTQGLPYTAEKPRAADAHEIRAYLEWLAAVRGITIPADARFYTAGIWTGTGEDARCVMDMPGYGVTDTGTMETLDEDGEVIRKVPLATDKKGKLVLTAAQIATACALPKVRKARKAAAKPVERAEPVSTTSAPSDDVVALLARVAALESAMRTVGLAVTTAKPVAANDDAAPPRRTERERAAILRAWRMRREMRERADLDRRALEAANVWARAEVARVGEALEQAANARTAATAYKSEMEAACIRADRTEADLRGARAEAAALVRKLEQSRSATVTRRALPIPMPVATALPRVLVGATR